MRNLSLFTLISVALFATPAHAANKALPLGIDLGTTTCTEISENKGSEWRLSDPNQSISVWSQGPMLKSANPRISGLEDASNLLIICDPQDRSIHISMTIKKASVQEIAKGLGSKYKAIQRNLPNLGNGHAKWAASNASISYQHVSFDALLSYETKTAEKFYDAYRKEENRRKQNATTNQL